LFTGRDELAWLAIAFGSVEAFRSAFDSFRSKRLDINTLMILAGAGAVAIRHYNDAATLLMLFSLSNTLEAFALGRTAREMEALIKLRPKTALRLRSGVVEEVPVEDLQAGDLVQVHAYSQVPADGVLVEGSTSFDESAMTGESVPVDKAPGDAALAGTQNLDGSITIRVTAAHNASSIDRVIEMVKEARANKAHSERISLWFGQTYTVAVVAAAAISFLIRYLLQPHDPGAAFYSSLTLLVALSPCALVISTPAAVLSALAFAARHGILVRGGATLEAAGRVTAVAFDKTGTLTLGQFELVEVALMDGKLLKWRAGTPVPMPISDALRLAAAVESRSTHPLAEAIAGFATAQGWEVPPVSDVRIAGGLGVTGTVSGKKVTVGRQAMFADGECEPCDEIAAEVERMRASGQTVALMGSDGMMCAIGLRDTLRRSAREMLVGLREVGVHRVALLTGDSLPAATAVASELGIAEVHAGLMPGEKTTLLMGIRAESGPVMMLGDGVNDAPALALADIGVAMGGLGSDVAIASADAVIVQDRLDRVPLLVRLGKACSRVVRQNLTVSALSIGTLTALSLIGVLPLNLAVVGHEGTTVVVILNGLRLLGGAR
jgi:Cd2+/Zn2+-exporting ATPase